VTGRGRARRELRLVVRRSRLTDPAQAALWPDWRHHAFITSLDTPTIEADQFHRDHATVELAIRDLKDGAGLEHCPSGRFFANAAWLACGVLAHNLWRWTAELADIRPHAPHPPARAPRPAREPRRTLDPAAPRSLALGRTVPGRAHTTPRAAINRRLTHPKSDALTTRSPARPHAARQPASSANTSTRSSPCASLRDHTDPAQRQHTHQHPTRQGPEVAAELARAQQGYPTAPVMSA
jgi:hypothetical protein